MLSGVDFMTQGDLLDARGDRGPIPFKCIIRPRSSIMKEAVIATLQD